MVCQEGQLKAFPVSQEATYKTLYLIYALNSTLSKQLQDVSKAIAQLPTRVLTYNVQGTNSHALICHGAQLTVAALLAFKLSDTSMINRTELIIAKGLLDCLLRLLKGISVPIN